MLTASSSRHRIARIRIPYSSRLQRNKRRSQIVAAQKRACSGKNVAVASDRRNTVAVIEVYM